MSDYLIHYGVKGMRWGVIRWNKNKQSRADRKAKKENWSDDAQSAHKLKSKKLNQMSNSEIRKLNERLLLERQYKDLTKKQKSKGAKVVSDVLGQSAKELAKNYIVKYSKKGIDAMIESGFGKR